ncbi:hypothetical protein PMKS-001325 [Pichia membranifaciens]|uniref:BZIP domain-containing protein n=1 Tax=Pichia membranifaciens TaxID=4926 RepID=A0A1Q2YE69_9ASCO|nr:hypothetical protein PMKS-001325 [Pichia membranifaciens]
MSSPQSDNSNSSCKLSADLIDVNSNGSHLPPRKRARTEAEKEQRRVERIIRNRKAAHASREKKRRHVEQLESYVKVLELHLNLSLEANRSLLSKLTTNNISCEGVDLKKLQVLRPDGLLLSDEDEASASINSNSASEDHVADSIIAQRERRIEQSNKCINAEEFDFNNDLEIEAEHEDDEADNSVVDEMPVLSKSSPSSVSASEFSNPPTPGNDENLFNLCRDQRDFNLCITNSNDFMDLNSYLEPEFSTSDFNEVDQSLDFKSTNDIIDSNGQNTMGYLSSYNSVHSAVMHYFCSSSSFGYFIQMK